MLKRIKEPINSKLTLAIQNCSQKKETVCDVDSGGGSLGAWSVGAKTALKDKGFLPAINMSCGTSVGALTAIASALNQDDWDKVLGIWTSIKSNKDIYSGMMQFNSFFDFIGMSSQIFKDNKGKYVLYPDGLYKIFNKYFGAYKFGDIKNGYKIVTTTTNLETLEMIEYVSTIDTDMPCVTAAKRSSAMNAIFPMDEDDKGQYVDGGWGNNTPVVSAIKHGATKIILIGVSPDKVANKRIKNNIIEIAGRSVESAMHTFEEKMWDEIKQYKLRCIDNPELPTIEILEIYPDKDNGNPLDFSEAHISKLLQDGYDWVMSNVSDDMLIDFLNQ